MSRCIESKIVQNFKKEAIIAAEGAGVFIVDDCLSQA
jgi:hypothetical protein